MVDVGISVLVAIISPMREDSYHLKHAEIWLYRLFCRLCVSVYEARYPWTIHYYKTYAIFNEISF